jgi:regulator of nonsense transcripts 2
VFADSNGDDNDDDNDDGDDAVAADNAAADDVVVVRPVDGSVHNDQLLQVFDKLMTVGNRQQLDDVVLEFAYLHTKRARERLVDFLYSVPWNRPELVPYFARAAATLAQIMHDVAPPLAVVVEKQFYGQLLNKHSVKLESKLRTGKMLAEMCKFRIVAPIVVFRVLHRCLQDWSPHFVQVLCAMLESCGRFLFLMPHTHRRTAELLTVLLRKMQSRPLDGHLTAAIENAMFACKPPPDFKAGRVRVRPPAEEAYIADLLYRRLSADTVRHVLRVLRSLPLADATWRARTLRLMLAVHRLRYSTLEVFASTVAGLARDWPGFVTTYVDALVERIRTGLLQRDQRRHLRQTVEVRLFAELYNYEQFQSDAVFNVLYHIILLGHSADPREINRLDPPSDWFRVRLVCATLDTCGLYFNRGPAAARLDRFLVFFQRYLFIKVSLPIEIQFVVDELFNELRPYMKRFESYEEAHAAVLAIEQNEALATAADNAAAAAVSEESSRLHASYDEGGSSSVALDASREVTEDGTPDAHSDDELNGAAATTAVADDDAAAVDDVPRVDDDLIDALGDQSDDSDVDEVAPDEDTFERDYASMVNEGGSKRRAHVNMSGMAIPMGLGHSSDGKSSGDTRQLRFLQKKQGHQAVKSNLVSRTIVVPEDTSIARAAVANRAEELATKIAIRDFVLARVAAGFDD